MADPERLDTLEQHFVDAFLACSPDLAGLVSLARRLSAMVRSQQAGLADGIRRDLDAVRAALMLPWSAGPVEGQISA